MPLPLAIVRPVLFHMHGLPQNTRRTYRIAILSEGFLPGEMAAFRIASLKVMSELLSTQPFKRQRDRIYIGRVDCTSLASAQVLRRLTSPPAGYASQTPFNVTFRLTLARGMTGDRAALRTVLAAVPGLPPLSVALVIVNNDASGGEADGDAAWLTLNDVGPTFVHELGHAGFGLADEYEYQSGFAGELPRVYSGSEPVYPNVTKERDRATVPWRGFFKPANVAIPTTTGPCKFNHKVVNGTPSDAVGLFEGANQHACDVFRPAATCKMREPGDFCPVCEQAIFGRLAGTFLDARPPFVVPAEPWTHMAPFPTALATPETFDLAAYNAQTGFFAIYFANEFDGSITPAGKPRGRTQLDPGFTTMACFNAGLEQFVYVDNLFTDRRMIFRFDRQGMLFPGNPSLVTRFAKPAGIVRGFSHTLPLTMAGQTVLLHYDRVTGGLELELFDPIAQAPVALASTAAGSMQPWHSLLSTLTSITIGGIPHVVGLDATNRKVVFARISLAPGGAASLTDTFVSQGFVLPFQTHAIGFEFHSMPMLFTYSSLGGTASIYEIRPDQSGMEHLYSWTLAPGASALFDVGLPAFGFMPPVDTPLIPLRNSFGRLWTYNGGLRRFTTYILR